MMSALLATSSLPIIAIRVLSPALVLLLTLSLFFVHPQPLSSSSPSPITPVVIATRVPRYAFILSLLSLTSFTFLFDGLTFVADAVLNKRWLHCTGIEVNTVLGLVAFAGLAGLGSWKDLHGVRVWSFKRVTSTLAVSLALDLTLITLLGFHIYSLARSLPHTPESPAKVPIVLLLHFVFPVLRTLLLASLLATLSFPRVAYTAIQSGESNDALDPMSSTFLLSHDTTHQASSRSMLPGDPSKYGTFPTIHSNLQRSAPTTRAATPAPSTTPDSKPDSKPEISLEPSWSEIWRRLMRLTPYLWPTKNGYLQLLAVLCIVILLLGRIINFAMPFALGQSVRLLEKPSERSPWPFLYLYVGLRFFQGSGGLPAVRDSLWAPVMQYSDREMSQLSFNHLLHLSFAWHTRRKTGEILRVLDRGAAINHTFELILFNIIPTFVDIFVALVTFCIFFEWTLGLVISFVMFAYVAASVLLTQWRTRIRRQMNERDVITRGIHTDCLLNYETVKYFGGEEHEGERYQEALREYQALEYKVIVSLNLLNMVQNLIITLGLLVGSMIVALRVTKGESDPGSFVVFITYLAQLYGPLNQLGYIYRSVNQSLIDTEKLLALLNEPTEVNDKPNAPDLIVHDGEIEFSNVNFSYDARTTALRGVSFKVPRGSSVALVGESGSGKSTILRLLYRFYDLREDEGSILIDGQDIRDVTQKSLRRAIGVVPQDSILFNASIAYNIGYGKFGSSLEEIKTAAKSAQMHDRIMSFSEGYDTKVGERGVRLSGGEKQRVAIARTLLKNPPILLLDEATSALDTSTEKDIQKALQNLMKGRSSISIAHRLSTIASADLILVLKDGQIVEQGSHKELLALDGLFAAMWADQVSASDDRLSLDDGSVKKEAPDYASGDAPSQSAGAVESQTNIAEPELSAVDALLTALSADAPIGTVSTEDAGGPLYIHAEDVHSNSQFHNHTADGSTFQVPTSAPPETTMILDSSPAPQPETALPLEHVSAPQGPAVTFPADLETPRTSTPNPDNEPKRRRISSQNFQRLARKISLGTRRQSPAPIIPGFKKDSPRASTEYSTQRAEGSVGNESTAGSLNEGDKKKKEKKKKTL